MRILKIFNKIVLAAIILLFINIIIAGVWFYKAPNHFLRKIVKPALEYKLSIGDFKVKISHLTKSEKSWYKFELDNIYVANDRQDNIKVKNINLLFRPQERWLFYTYLIDLNIANVEIDTNLTINPSSSRKSQKTTETILEDIANQFKINFFEFQNILIKNIDFNFNDISESFQMQDISLTKDHNLKHIKLNLQYLINDQQHELQGQINYHHKDESISLDFGFQQLPLHLFVIKFIHLFPTLSDLYYHQNQINLNGTLKYKYILPRAKHSLALDLQNSSALIMAKLDENLILQAQDFHCKFLMEDNFNFFKVNGCHGNFNQDTNVDLSGFYRSDANKINAPILEFSGELKNLDTQLYKIFYNPKAPDEVSEFLETFIKKGVIDSGKWHVKLGSQFFLHNSLNDSDVKADFHIKDVDFEFDSDMPMIENINSKVSVINDKVSFDFESANLLNSKFSNTVIHFNWPDIEKNKVFVASEVSGPANDLVEFIADSTLQKIANDGIDLRTIKGKADSTVNIIIPISKGTKDTYDIKSDITIDQWSIFSQKFNLNNAKLSGVYNGEDIKISGKGEVDGILSDINYQYNIENHENFIQQLLIDLNLKNGSNLYNFAKITDGESKINFKYFESNKENYFSLNSDLRNSGFIIEKIGLEKLRNRGAKLEIFNDLSQKQTNITKFSLKGQDNLHLEGSGTFNVDKAKINVPTIKYGKTNTSGSLQFSDDLISIKIKEGALDLSKANFQRLLEKESRGADSMFDVTLNNVYLKNDVILNNVSLALECNKTHCSRGFLDSSLGNDHLFKMELFVYEGYEDWLIMSDDAGAVLKGLGMYDKVSDGNLVIQVKTSRKFDRPGNQININEGKIILKKFLTTNQSIAGKLISFISFPGIMKLGSKEIPFNQLDADFTFSDGVINVSNGKGVGPFFDFTASGRIDTLERKVHIQGTVIPALYGINNFLKIIPVINQMRGIISLPYVINQAY